MSASISWRSRVSRSVLSSPSSATDAPRDRLVATTAVTTQARIVFIMWMLLELVGGRCWQRADQLQIQSVRVLDEYIPRARVPFDQRAILRQHRHTHRLQAR